MPDGAGSGAGAAATGAGRWQVAAIVAALGARHVGTFDECVEHTPRPSVIAAAEAARALLDRIAQKLGSLLESLQDAIWCLLNIAPHKFVEPLRTPSQGSSRIGFEPALHDLARELQPRL